MKKILILTMSLLIGSYAHANNPMESHIFVINNGLNNIEINYLECLIDNNNTRKNCIERKSTINSAKTKGNNFLEIQNELPPASKDEYNMLILTLVIEKNEKGEVISSAEWNGESGAMFTQHYPTANPIEWHIILSDNNGSPFITSFLDASYYNPELRQSNTK